MINLFLILLGMEKWRFGFVAGDENKESRSQFIQVDGPGSCTYRSHDSELPEAVINRKA